MLLIVLQETFYYNSVYWRNKNESVLKWQRNIFATQYNRIVHFTVVCLVAKPLNRSEAKVDFVVIQTLLLFISKSLCYHAN